VRVDAAALLLPSCLQESDSEGVPDDELAKRAWDNYRLRNDSHVVDHFQVGGCCWLLGQTCKLQWSNHGSCLV
jgi:hypothetical protein